MVYILPILHTRDYLDGHQTFSHRVFTLVSDKLKRKWLWLVYLLIPKDNQHKKMTTELLPWLQETVAVRSLFEVNCISNLKPYHTLQLTTLRTSVSESLQLHYKNMMLLWWFSRRCSVVTYYCMLFDTFMCDLFQRCMISDGFGKLPLWLSHAIS